VGDILLHQKKNMGSIYVQHREGHNRGTVTWWRGGEGGGVCREKKAKKGRYRNGEAVLKHVFETRD